MITISNKSETVPLTVLTDISLRVKSYLLKIDSRTSETDLLGLDFTLRDFPIGLISIRNNVRRSMTIDCEAEINKINYRRSFLNYIAHNRNRGRETA